MLEDGRIIYVDYLWKRNSYNMYQIRLHVWKHVSKLHSTGKTAEIKLANTFFLNRRGSCWENRQAQMLKKENFDQMTWSTHQLLWKLVTSLGSNRTAEWDLRVCTQRYMPKYSYTFKYLLNSRVAQGRSGRNWNSNLLHKWSQEINGSAKSVWRRKSR